MTDIESKYRYYIGNNIVVNGNDYGTIVSVQTIYKENKVVFVFVTDIGKKVETESYLRYLGIGCKVYPDGSAYAFRLREPKRKTRNICYVPGKNIRNIAHFDNKNGK
jgi:hypothetical protein